MVTVLKIFGSILWYLLVVATACAIDALRIFYFLVITVPLTLIEGYREGVEHFDL